MKNIMMEELTYYLGYESFCYQNCLRILLEAYGVNNAALYINAGLSLVVKENKGNIKITYNKGSRDLLPQYAKHVTRYYYNRDVSGETIFAENITLLNRINAPIIVGLDTFYLPYASNYKANHAIHTAIMCNYNSNSHDIEVVDYYEPWLFRGTVKENAFIQSRSSLNAFDGTVYSGVPINNNWASFDGTQLEASPQLLLKQILDLTIKQFFTHSDMELTGMDGLQRILNYCIKLYSGPNDWKERFKQLHIELFGLRKRFKFFQQYLKIASEYVKIRELSQVVSFLDKVDEKWDIILLIVLKLSRKESDKVIQKLKDNFNDMLEMDRQLEQLLRLILKQI